MEAKPRNYNRSRTGLISVPLLLEHEKWFSCFIVVLPLCTKLDFHDQRWVLCIRRVGALKQSYGRWSLCLAWHLLVSLRLVRLIWEIFHPPTIALLLLSGTNSSSDSTSTSQATHYDTVDFSSKMPTVGVIRCIFVGGLSAASVRISMRMMKRSWARFLASSIEVTI